MKNKKTHYYDGHIYKVLIDPYLREVRSIISSKIEKGSKVVDLGCGTGALVFTLAHSCQLVTGIELSEQMIKYAQRSKQLKQTMNVHFQYGDASYLPKIKNDEYDYAVISMALHEMPPPLRLKVLWEAKRIATTVIIADYVTPLPVSLAGIGARITEFFAGQEHYRMFRHFQKSRGIEGLLEKNQISRDSETTNKKGTIEVVVAK